MKKLCILLFILLLLFLGAVLFLFVKYADNTTLQLTTYQISHKKIPSEFNGFRIAQVSDLHNAEFGEGNADLLALLSESDPDIIVFTGDQIDARRLDLDVAVHLAREAVKIAPCYLVTGNHEGSIPEIFQLNAELDAAGVIRLEDEILELRRGDDKLQLIGVNDPTMKGRFLEIGQEAAMDEVLASLSPDFEGYTVLLSHHPEYLELYSKHGIDLALCGHAHGGQVRLGNRGIIAPHQGLFPKYDAGRYTMGKTDMILSRGLGNSLFPWRINNPPELVMIELSAEDA
jgi:predicted MPP superfamily phosphohydrolase